MNNVKMMTVEEMEKVNGGRHYATNDPSTAGKEISEFYNPDGGSSEPWAEDLDNIDWDALLKQLEEQLQRIKQQQ